MDPYLTLSVPPNAGDEEIRKAYLGLVKRFPPDRCNEKFQSIQAAYDTISTAQKRAHHFLFNLEPPIQTPLEAVLAVSKSYKNTRKPLSGPKFLELLKTYV